MTPAAERVLRFIWLFHDTKGYCPTLREIGEGIGTRSVSTIDAHVRNLQAEGLVDLVSGVPRTLHLTEEGFYAMRAGAERCR